MSAIYNEIMSPRRSAIYNEIMSPLEWLASQGVQGARSGGKAGSNIGPNSDPEDPNTWPPGVKPAPGFGYLDSTGMWIPTPFDTRSGNRPGDPPKGSPANVTGIPHNKYTPFQLKLEKMRWKNAYNNGSLIEQSKIIPLPGGAPEIPGYKRVDPSQFSTATGAQIGPSNIYWAYAYKSNSVLNKNIILISPTLYYNTKASIGRHYRTWGSGRIRSDNDKVPSANGPVYVSLKDFIVNDMILSVIVHVSVGAPNIGPQILQSIKI